MIASLLEERIRAIDRYLSRHGLDSYDPYDGLSARWVYHVVGGNQLLSRVWQQFVRLLPINLRWVLGIKKIAHTKAISDFASAYCLLYRSTGNEAYADKAKTCLAMLKDIPSTTQAGLGWGLRFPFATRFVMASESEANIFQTINVIHSFLDAYDAFRDEQYLGLAEKGFRFLTDDLGFKETDKEISWNYWKNLDVNIFNINGLMIGLSARMWATTGVERFRDYTKKLFAYIERNQNPDGSWYYSADSRGKFIDGFHTGYILEGILRAIELGLLEKGECIRKGIDFYLMNFFTKDSIPKYFHHSTYPMDGQNFAQAIQTLHFIINANFAAKNKLIDCIERVDGLLWNKKGYYNYKKSFLLTYRTPMHRWVTGPFFLALAYSKKDVNSLT